MSCLHKTGDPILRWILSRTTIFLGDRIIMRCCGILVLLSSACVCGWRSLCCTCNASAHAFNFHAGIRWCKCRMSCLMLAALLTFQRIVGASGASSLSSFFATMPAAHALESADSSIVAVATPDVFNDLPSGLRVTLSTSYQQVSPCSHHSLIGKVVPLPKCNWRYPCIASSRFLIPYLPGLESTYFFLGP